ncbi:MAG TPA: FAD-dependent tricarballylate dehydrogenase TcuA, partial [candidate division Zixibacteria bacterium]|nr:FAD-dependent tricarballylate dehydrogenase TcuA [candidate division Zixibacteria bacterium]
SVTGEDINGALAELTIAESEAIVGWMVAHGAHWQAPLKGTLGLARTNHFFLGGGKSLLNAYYLTARDIGVDVRYQALVTALDFDGPHCRGVHVRIGPDGNERFIETDTVVVAAGGFEANLDWLAEYWGPAAHNFVIRGTRNNDGSMLRALLDAGARRVGDPASAHAIAVDARAPQFDAGIITRIDAIPIGIAVNCNAERFYDEGEDMWPKRYATWGRLIAAQPEQKAFAIFDSKVAGEIIPGLYRPYEAGSIRDLAGQLGLSADRLAATVNAFNAACRVGRFDLSEKDECHTEGLTPPKSHWARPIDAPPFYGYPLRPGITFTYMGVAVDVEARVQCADGGTFDNVFAAGEVMSGNILTRGYLAGFGMTIGSVWGRIAGRSAARA